MNKIKTQPIKIILSVGLALSALSFLLLTLNFKLLTTMAASSDPSLSISNISTATTPGYVVYWTKGAGNVTLKRSEAGGASSTIATTTNNFYADTSVTANKNYTYSATISGKELAINSNNDSGGKPTISNITIEAGATSKTESSLILSFSTDTLSKSQVFYGESLAYSNETTLDQSLNQSHTVLIEKLKPNTTYHLKIKAISKDDSASSESTDQTFTTSKPATDQTLMQVIINALVQAFAGFGKIGK